ncbi:MAG: hypothetical protein HYU64_19255 [Armatimonadetes bacterium]|nr:hypothetical protein [Armatimonadota bacterium]
MELNPLSTSVNAARETYRIPGTESTPYVPADKSVFGIKPGGITCYMYAAIRDLASENPEQLAQMRRDAVNWAIGEGIVSSETAEKLQCR